MEASAPAQTQLPTPGPPPFYEVAELATLLHAELINPPPASCPIHHVVYDSRRIAYPAVSLFVALSGPIRDGHTFLPHAASQGIAAALVRFVPSGWPAYLPALVVPDPLSALQHWAELHRARFAGPVVGITGSNGKTVVKEWLYALLGGTNEVYRSPGSFNSQLGVALAILGLRAHHQIAIIEAGISQPGEMARLQAMIKPTHGIFTHFGASHQAHFTSRAEKRTEKLRLFSDTPVVLSAQALNADELPVAAKKWVAPRAADLLPAGTRLPYTLPEDLQNLGLAVAMATELGLSPELLAERLTGLYPVRMRSELITDNPEVRILNDAYNADEDSVLFAFKQLRERDNTGNPHIILTDLEDIGADEAEVHQRLLQQALATVPPGHLWLIGKAIHEAAEAVVPDASIACYPDTLTFLQQFQYGPFRNSTVLLKGARRFELERIIPYLSLQASPTVLRVSLNAYRDNLRTLRQVLPPACSPLVMLKASAYGGGDWQLGQVLDQEMVPFVGVAHTVEGIRLRENGLKARILVLYPDPDTLYFLPQYRLEPAVGDVQQLNRLLAMAPTVALHLEVDTGMARLGFAPEDMAAAVATCQRSGAVVASVFSHLAAADNPAQDAFTEEQLRRFAVAAGLVKAAYPNALRHVLNSAGVQRFSEQAFEMVRLGIGLFGDELPTSGQKLALQEVIQLETRVASVRTLQPGENVGYGGRARVARTTRLATLPVGYADGIPRALGNGVGQVLLHGLRCPIIGQVCMDLLMVDVTDLPQNPPVSPGTEAVLLGYQAEAHISLKAFAEACGTIPYEVLTRFSQRIRRVYAYA